MSKSPHDWHEEAITNGGLSIRKKNFPRLDVTLGSAYTKKGLLIIDVHCIKFGQLSFIFDRRMMRKNNDSLSLSAQDPQPLTPYLSLTLTLWEAVPKVAMNLDPVICTSY